MKMVFTLLTLFLSLTAYAQVLDLGDGLKVSQEQLETLKKQFPRTTEDRTFFHWTRKSNAMRWVTQKQISEGEMNFLNTPTGDRQAYGPGFYIAEKPISSQSFGEAPVSLVLKKGTPIYDPSIAEKVIGAKPTANQEAKLGEALQLLKPASDDWYVLNNAVYTQDIFYGRFANPEAHIYVQMATNWSPFAIAEDFRELINAGDQDAMYLQDILYASDYMDGVSFARAMKVSPGAPWKEFEPEGFNQYKQALEYFSEKTGKSSFGEERSTRAETIRNKGIEAVDQSLLEVNNQFHNKNFQTLKDAFRSEGIRAGGDEAGNTFEVTKEQLKVLQENPYLEVSVVKQGDGILVNYFYPDAFHYKKLKDRISPELYQKLEKYSGLSLMNNHELRQSLNKQLIQELVNDFTTRMKNGEASWTDLISIHPFEDKNGRSVRMLQKIYNPSVQNFFIGDMDLLAPKDKQNLFLDASSNAHTQMQADLLDEFLKAKTQRRMPNYLNSKTLDNYVDNALPFAAKIDLNSPVVLEQIRRRDWEDLLTDAKSSGVDALRKRLKDSENYDLSTQRLNSVIRDDVLFNYDETQKAQLVELTNEVIESSKTPIEKKAELFENYQNLYEKTNSSLIQGVKPIEEIKAEMLEGIIKALTIKDKVPDDYFGLFSLIDQFETDPYKNLKIYLDIIKECNPGIMSTLASQMEVKYTSLLEYDVFKTLPKEQQMFLGEHALQYVTDMIDNYMDTNSFLVTYENIFNKSPELAKSLTHPNEFKIKVLTKISKQLEGGNFGTKAKVFNLYNSIYEVTPAEIVKSFPPVEPIKTGLLEELKVQFKTMTESDSWIQMTYLNYIENDELKQIDFMIENAKLNPNPKIIINNAANKFSMSLYQPSFVSLEENKRIALLKKAPELMEKLMINDVDPDQVKTILANYEESFNAESKDITKKVLNPDKLKSNMKTWGAKNPGPNNCVTNLLKAIFS